MITTQIGRQAEAAVAEKLKKDGYKILARNWRTNACEIDIVASKNNVIYFVEVKYRSQTHQGSGLEYIGPQKIRQINFAARMWVQLNNWPGDYRLLAAEVSDSRIKAVDYVEIG